MRPTAYFFSNECVYVRLSMNEDANNLLFFSLSECSHPSKLNVCSLSAQFFGEAGRERNKKIDKVI